MDPLARLEQWTASALGVPAEVLERVLATALVVLAYLLVRRVTRRIVARTLDETSSRYQVTRFVAYGFGVLALVVLAKIWFAGVTGYATYLGLASAGVAIALQDPLTNLAGWFFILVRRPFAVGDRIQIGAHSGDVVDIRIFRFLMLEIGNWVHADQSTGRLLQVPNGWVFKNAIASYDQAFGYIWNELEVVLTFESNWRRAKEVLLSTLEAHAEKIGPEVAARLADAADHFHIKVSKVTPVVWTSTTDSGIKLTLRYLCKPRERRSSASEIWESILDAVEGMGDVDLAYPTTRWYDDGREGKRAKASP
jgi:small-conductance mechanosensitive channel